MAATHDSRTHTIDDVVTIALQRFARDDGELVVADSTSDVGFPIQRVFTVTAPLGAERGKHAHLTCSQFMLCTHGAIDIVCDDGERQKTIPLDRGDVGLLVPPTIWSTVIYREQNSVLTVLCDRAYEADDYIREYEAFRSYRVAAQQLLLSS